MHATTGVAARGAHYDEVVAKWGAPVRHATLCDGRNVYAWDAKSVGSIVSPGLVGVYGGSEVGVGIVRGLPGLGGGELQRCAASPACCERCCA